VFDCLSSGCRLHTALHKAAWYGYRGICKILVDSGASLLRKDYQVGKHQQFVDIASFPGSPCTWTKN